MTVLDGWWSYFVAPATARAKDGDPRTQGAADRGCRGRRPAPAPPAVAILGSGRVAADYGVAVGTRLAHRGGTGTAVVAVWDGTEAPTVTDTTARARGRRNQQRVIAELDACGLSGLAVGRVVMVRLGLVPQAALADVDAIVRCTDAALVIVLTGPRSAAIDALLDRAGRVAVLASDVSDTLTALAVERLRASGLAAGAAELPPRELLALARRGLPITGSLRDSIDRACDGQR